AGAIAAAADAGDVRDVGGPRPGRRAPGELAAVGRSHRGLAAGAAWRSQGQRGSLDLLLWLADVGSRLSLRRSPARRRRRLSTPLHAPDRSWPRLARLSGVDAVAGRTTRMLPWPGVPHRRRRRACGVVDPVAPRD